jgi:hypothetical protein
MRLADPYKEAPEFPSACLSTCPHCLAREPRDADTPDTRSARPAALGAQAPTTRTSGRRPRDVGGRGDAAARARPRHCCRRSAPSARRLPRLDRARALASATVVRGMNPRSLSVLSALAVLAVTVTPATALAGTPSARPATRSERSAIMKSLIANDGSSSGVQGVYVSRSNSSLAVVCVRTPETSIQAFVFDRVKRSWRFVTYGLPGHAGNAADRRLERACG